jgi:hypothetical protein
VETQELEGYMYLYGEVGADYISDVEIPSLNKREEILCSTLAHLIFSQRYLMVKQRVSLKFL